MPFGGSCVGYSSKRGYVKKTNARLPEGVACLTRVLGFLNVLPYGHADSLLAVWRLWRVDAAIAEFTVVYHLGLAVGRTVDGLKITESQGGVITAYCG